MSTSSRSPASFTTLRSRPVPGTGRRWWCRTNTFQLGRCGELLPDPVVPLPADLALVDVRLARVDAHDPDRADVCRPVPGADQLFEVHVPDVARVVVAGNDVHRGLDALGVGHPVLVLLSVALVGEVAGVDHGIRSELVQLGHDAVHEIGDEVRRSHVQVGDVGDRDHVRVVASRRRAPSRARRPRPPVVSGPGACGGCSARRSGPSWG